jgi:putative inorganic carbon (hco3(-)) transporter
MPLAKIEQWCTTAAVLCYCALIYFLPISIALVESFSGGAIFFYLLKKIAAGCQNVKGAVPRGSILSVAMVVNIAVVFVTIFFSQYVQVSLYAFFGKFLQGCFLYYCFVECFQSRKYLRWFTAAFAVSATVICLAGLFQYVFHKDFVRWTPLMDGRVSSTFRHANDFGAYLILVTSILLAFVFSYVFMRTATFRFKILLVIVQVLTLVCLGLTYSRSAWIGFFAASLFIGLVHRRLVPSLLMIFCFVGVFTPLMMTFRQVSFMSDDLKHERQDLPLAIKENYKEQVHMMLQQFSGMGRLTFWKEAVEMIQKSPWVGSGLNTYSRMGPHYKITWGGYPHNCYLQMAAEIGLLGLTAFLILVMTLFVRVLLLVREMKNLFLKNLTLGALAGLFGFFIQSAFDTTLYSVQLANLMWIMMGLIVASVDNDRRLSGQQVPPWAIK